MKTKYFIFFSFLWLLASMHVTAQSDLELPRVSQRAEVTQRLGYTDISVIYSSPYVNGRKIWDGLVPYGKVWRAGANENTTISFTDDVNINGNPLPAGTYGLHMIPNADEWVIIFSKDHTSWGSFFYDQAQDALRIKVKPEPHQFQEWLDYTFTDRAAASCKVTLSWENLKVSFPVSVDLNAITLRHIHEQLKNTPGFGWQGWEQAAQYCNENKIDYNEALKWINNSIKVEENFTNVSAKAKLFELMGNTKEADETKMRGLKLAETANENSVNQFGYGLMAENDLITAIEVFRINIKNHPDSWNVYDSMGEAFAKTGDNKQALSNYKTALSKAPDDQKDRIKKIITSLEKG